MPKLAKTINLKRRGRDVTLTIDGEEFAWYLAAEPITTTTDPNEPGTVNLTLIAEHVTIDDTVGAAASPYEDQRATDSLRPNTPDYITVDGETVTLPYGSHDVREVLAAAGVHAGTHDLIRIDDDGHTITHRSGDTVKVEPGDEFVTASISTN